MQLSGLQEHDVLPVLPPALSLQGLGSVVLEKGSGSWRVSQTALSLHQLTAAEAGPARCPLTGSLPFLIDGLVMQVLLLGTTDTQIAGDNVS